MDQFVGVNIVDLEIKGCEELKYLWRGSEAAGAILQSCANLKRLSVEKCSRLESLVEGEGEGKGEEERVLPHNLEELRLISCENLEKLPHNWRNNLMCLKSLTIMYCPKLQSSRRATMTHQQQSGGGDILIKQSSSRNNEIAGEIFSQLESMVISSCSSLTRLPTAGQKKKLPTTLKRLDIEGWEQLEGPEEKNRLLNTKSSHEIIRIPDWGNLKSFTSSTGNRKLVSTRGGRGFGFQNFIHLTSLTIRQCGGLESFLERGGLPPA